MSAGDVPHERVVGIVDLLHVGIGTVGPVHASGRGVSVQHGLVDHAPDHGVLERVADDPRSLTVPAERHSMVSSAFGDAG